MAASPGSLRYTVIKRHCLRIHSQIICAQRLDEEVSERDWNTLYREMLPRVYNFFWYRVPDRMVAEDLTSITFKRAWQNRERYSDSIASFSTWLFTIARRVAADYFRGHYQRNDVALEAATSIGDGQSPELLTELRETIECVKTLIERLPEREQELIALRYGAGMSYQEMAALTGLNATNVGVILHRTIRKLREQLKVNDEPFRR
jgi:RNA polymerase sigma-70 factor (ECF subfamily)